MGNCYLPQPCWRLVLHRIVHPWEDYLEAQSSTEENLPDLTIPQVPTVSQCVVHPLGWLDCRVYDRDLFGRCCRMNRSEQSSLLCSGCTISMLKNLSHEETHLPCLLGTEKLPNRKINVQWQSKYLEADYVRRWEKDIKQGKKILDWDKTRLKER